MSWIFNLILREILSSTLDISKVAQRERHLKKSAFTLSKTVHRSHSILLNMNLVFHVGVKV